MKTRLLLLSFMVCLFSFSYPCSKLFGQVVQLPTIQTFSVNTTVLAPDSGGAYMGGNRTLSSGSVSRGPFPRNRGIGGQAAAGGISTHVQIIDLEALDKAILAAAQQDNLAMQRSLQNPMRGSQAQAAPGQGVQDRSAGQASGRGQGSGLASNNSRMNPNATSNAAPGAPSWMGPSRPAAGSRAPASNQFAVTDQGSNRRKADYDYLMILSNPSHPEVANDLLGDVSHDLEQARNAKAGSRWTAAQLFYEQAWNRLSPERQQFVLSQLNDRQIKSPEVPASIPNPSRSSSAKSSTRP